MGERLIVVGRNSYIGRYFAKYAREQGFQVIGLSSAECNFLDNQAVCRFFRTLSDQSYTVIFLAVINKSVANTYRSYCENIQIVRNLVEGYSHGNIDSILYFSSVDIFGAHPSLPINEETKANPDTWYGLAKYTCEWMLSTSGELTCPVGVLRIPGIYGGAANDRSVIGRMVQNIREEGKAYVTGSGRVLRDYVYVADLSRLVVELLPRCFHGVLNIATGKCHSIIEIVESIRRVLQVDFEVVHLPAEPEREFDLVFDNSRLGQLVPGFRFTDLATGIGSYLPTAKVACS